MRKGYNAPAEVRELEKLLNDFTYRNGLDVRTVFQDLLRYIIHGFSPGAPPLTDWKYKKEQTKVFYYMYTTWVQIMAQQIKRHGWYDAFGDLFMALTSQRGQQQKGQFFTPAHVTEVMAKIAMGDDKSLPAIPSVYDPTAGSGRILLAAKAERPQSYLVGWDIDYTCCLMCVCNFLMNSCVGEVVCIDSLRMDNFRGAWIVNESLYRTGLPSVRKLDEQEYKLFKQANIPPYVFFLNQEGCDDYFRMRETWTKIMSLFQKQPAPEMDV